MQLVVEEGRDAWMLAGENEHPLVRGTVATMTLSDMSDASSVSLKRGLLALSVLFMFWLEFSLAEADRMRLFSSW